MTAAPKPAGRTRGETIACLRSRLIGLGDGEHSVCKVAADRGIFCRGFRRWSDREFHDRFKGTLGVSTHLTRPQMEELADLWQLTEQLSQGIALICDAPAAARAACRGWDEFTDLEIQGFGCEMIGQGRLP
jgi:hypothetical protein